MRKFLLLSFLVLFCSGLYAQSRVVTGKVTSSEDGQPIPGVGVQVKGTTIGVPTDLDGNYRIEFSEQNAVLVFKALGMVTKEVTVGNQSRIDVVLDPDVKTLGEVIVTGVAAGTSTTKLGFAVGKVGEDLLREVPAVDAGNALRGKVSGVQIIQGNGLQGSAPSIRLRGANNLSTSVSQQPLIIIDGIITPPGGSALADINMNDVESIEVIKGAAGASLYGSLAGNGVVQIITKRGSREAGQTRVTVRNEYGMSQIQRKMPINRHHRYQLDANGELALNASGQPISDSELIHDNPWPIVYDHQGELFTSRGYSNNYVSVASSTEKTNFLASFDNTNQNGIIEGLAAFDRQNIRLNVDHRLNDRFKLTLSSLYSISEGPSVAGQGGQGGIVYEVTRLSPNTDIRANNFDGQPFNTTNIGGIFNIGRNVNNPLYTAYNDQLTVNRQRFLGNATASYTLTDWLRLEGQFSLDRANNEFQRFRDVRYLNINSGAANPYTNSLLNNQSTFNTAQITTFSSYFTKEFGEDLKFNGVLRYQGESYQTDFRSFTGDNLEVPGIRQEQNTLTTSRDVNSSNDIFRAENVFANVSFDYKDRYIVEALIRNDRSSLFGEDERSQFFYRFNGAYRLSEDFSIPGIQEFKLRAAYGTSGQRPPFEAQYETYNISGGVATPGILGNRQLRPSVVTELEVGTNIYFLDRFSFEFNYARSQADDQILLVPLSSAAGFTAQWQNAASLESNSFEFSLNAIIKETSDFRWDMGLVGSRTRSVVTSLNRAPYQIGGGAVGSGGVFRIEEGEVFGAIYGNVIASSLDQLVTNASGIVTNLSGLSNRSLEEFTVNEDGFVILAGTEYTAGESVYYLTDETGNRVVNKIGDTTPDMILGFNNTISYKGLSLFFLMDAQIGGDIANVNKQNMLFNTVAEELDQSNKPVGQRKFEGYYLSLSNSGFGANQYIIEDGSYLTLREVAISYNFSRDFLERLGGIGKVIYDAKFSLIGRNLYTFTNYSGWTPEVAATGGSDAAANNPFNFRADYGAVPLFRTYSASLQLRF